MPDKSVLLILNRAFVDERFRQQLNADLDGAVAAAGITLSAEARDELKQALDEGHDFATGLDQRVSQSGFALNPASLMRQKGGTKEHVSDAVPRHQSAAKAKRQQTFTKHVAESRETVAKLTTTSEAIEYDEIDIEVETD